MDPWIRKIAGTVASNLRLHPEDSPEIVVGEVLLELYRMGYRVVPQLPKNEGQEVILLDLPDLVTAAK